MKKDRLLPLSTLARLGITVQQVLRRRLLAHPGRDAQLVIWLHLMPIVQLGITATREQATQMERLVPQAITVLRAQIGLFHVQQALINRARAEVL